MPYHPLILVSAARACRPPLTEPGYSLALGMFVQMAEEYGGDDHMLVDGLVSDVITGYQRAAMDHVEMPL